MEDEDLISVMFLHRGMALLDDSANWYHLN